MRSLSVALLLAAIGLVVTAAGAEPVSACTGRVLQFKEAIGMSKGAIYFGRITRADTAATFWIDLTIDIDGVVRGPAVTRLRRAQAGEACDPILAGQSGFIVRSVRDPQYPGTGSTDLFFRFSRSLTRSDARAALLIAGLPDTSTLSETTSDVSPRAPWTWLALWSASGFVVSYLGLRGRHRARSVS